MSPTPIIGYSFPHGPLLISKASLFFHVMDTIGTQECTVVEPRSVVCYISALLSAKSRVARRAVDVAAGRVQQPA
jgi:hypothetical protein